MSWPPHITVATIVCQDEKFLMVEETSDGKLVYNQPAGHLEPNESLEQAAIRETFEETGWLVAPKHVSGIYKYVAPNGTVYYRTTFIADALKHDPDVTLDEGIERAVWLSYDELKAQADKMRSPLVLKNIEDYLSGCKYPLSLIDDHE